MQAITQAMKAQLVKDIISKDKWVKGEVDFDDESNPTQVLFFTTDPVSDEFAETGYFSDEGYDWDSTGYFSPETQQELLKLGISGDRIQGNDCEGFENEYAIFLD